jgi:hypothetical protein
MWSTCCTLSLHMLLHWSLHSSACVCVCVCGTKTRSSVNADCVPLNPTVRKLSCISASMVHQHKPLKTRHANLALQCAVQIQTQNFHSPESWTVPTSQTQYSTLKTQYRVAALPTAWPGTQGLRTSILKATILPQHQHLVHLFSQSHPDLLL